MTYVATLTIDYGLPHNDRERYRLFKAMEHIGWQYVETSAMHIQTDDLDQVLEGVEALARAAGLPGVLTNLSLTVQLIGNPRSVPGTLGQANSYTEVMARELPSARH